MVAYHALAHQRYPAFDPPDGTHASLVNDPQEMPSELYFLLYAVKRILPMIVSKLSGI